MDVEANGKSPVLVARWTHVILTVLVWLFMFGLTFGTIRTQLDEVQRQQRLDEQNFVSKDRFEEAAQDMKARLERIERKIDAEKTMRELDETYGMPSKKN